MFNNILKIYFPIIGYEKIQLRSKAEKGKILLFLFPTYTAAHRQYFLAHDAYSHTVVGSLTSSFHTMEIHPLSFLDKVKVKTEKHWISKVHIFMDWTEFQYEL